MEDIYHLSWMVDGDRVLIDRVLREGLKSRSQLTKEDIWKAALPVNDFEQWRFNCVYFGLSMPPKNVDWFSLLVDPHETLVGNQSLEHSYDAYRKSIMSLAEYLDKQKQGKGEFKHPLTAERLEKKVEIIVPDSFCLDHIGIERTKQVINYCPEVFIEQAVIPAHRIHRFNRVSS